MPGQFQILNRWPDGSVQWLLCDLLWEPESTQAEVFELIRAEPEVPRDRVEVRAETGSIAVGTGLIDTEFVTGAGLLGPVIQGGTRVVESLEVELRDGAGNSYAGSVETFEILSEGPLRARVESRGRFAKSRVEFRCWADFYAKSGRVQLEFEFTHSGSAAHPGGCWDLGDAGSVDVQSVCLTLNLSELAESIRYTVDGGTSFKDSVRFPVVIEQASSGGARWNSRNHIDATGQSPLPYRGYRLLQPDSEEHRGLRAEPWFSHKLSGERWISSGVRSFWQNFPIRQKLTARTSEIELLAAPPGRPIEFQGGERKSHRIDLMFSDTPERMASTAHPPQVELDCEVARRSCTFPHLVTGKQSVEWWELVEGVVDGADSFFSKRELVDEYGWRHFGELFADHEAVRSEPAAPIASHYNNQYDPIYCLLRQYLSRGDSRWFQLADDLARHVRDIDIYHTDDDREEYNGGLFWHTDHYLDAGTCTHRSYSRRHADVTGRAGGGHSLEHVYAQGLAYHYLLTGSVASRDAVIRLADWVMKLSRGPSTLVGTLYRFRRHRSEFRHWLLGRSPHYYRYPFNRATGNSVHTMLDAGLISGNTEYLVEAGRLIRNCAGPADDPAERDLLNAEANWSYTVFLDSVARFLLAKEQLGQLDTDYAYAVAMQQRYGRWMVLNERTYLEQIENLEFPNETWPAQDFRKAKVIFAASRYLPPEEAERAVERAISLFELAMSQLYSFPPEKRRLTRPVVLLLQNLEPYLEAKFGTIDSVSALPAEPQLPVPSFGSYVVSQLGYALGHTTLLKEFRWIRARVRNAQA